MISSNISHEMNFLHALQLTMYPNQVREVKNKLNCWITDDDGNDVETGMHNMPNQ